MGPWSMLQLVAIAAAFAWLMKRTPGDRARLRLCFLWALPFAGVGALGLGVVLRIPAWICEGFQTAILLHDGDFMAYGALAGLVVAYAAFARQRGLAPWEALDALAAPLGILVGVARIGCFVAGCDYGRVTQVPWAIRYAPGTAAFLHHQRAGWITASSAGSLPVHPAQLYESLVGLAMTAAVLLVERHDRRGGRVRAPGALFTTAALIYALGRFTVELCRGDDRGMLGPLSTPQWLSVAVLLYFGANALDPARSARTGSE